MSIPFSPPPEKSLHSLIDRFIADRRAAGAAPSTVRYYRQTLDRFARDASGDLGDAAHAFAVRCYAHARSEASACTYVRAVAVFLNWARAVGAYNGPVRLKCRSRLAAPSAVALGDLRRALRRLDGEAALLVRFLLATGARLGEALGVRWGDIAANGDVVIRGKGARYRRVPLSRRLRRLLVPLARHSDHTARVFGMPRRWYQERIRAAARRTDIRLSAHRLRHTYAAETLGRGAPLNAIQRVLGHSGPQMTLHYGRLYGREAVEIARRYSPEDRL